MPSLSLSTPALVRSTPSEPPSARIRQQIMTSIRRTVCFSYSSTSPESKTVKNEMYFKNVNRKKTKTKAAGVAGEGAAKRNTKPPQKAMRLKLRRELQRLSRDGVSALPQRRT